MTPDEKRAREKIFQATLDLITEGEDAERLTTRQIAAKAGVNQALVNYYYQSKENLLSQVVGTMMEGLISRVLQQESLNADALTVLRNILMATADVAFKYHNVCRIAIAAELKNGCRNSCEMVRPFLREVLREHSESDLSIIALQLMLPFHHIVLDPQIYNRYLGTDFFDETQRREKIDQMIECVLRRLPEEARQ